MRAATTLLLSVLVITGCGDGKPPPSYRGGETRTLAECLESIKTDSGRSSLDIITDKPDEVSGFFAGSKKPFGCSRKESGTKGVYFEGFYEE